MPVIVAIVQGAIAAGSAYLGYVIAKRTTKTAQDAQNLRDEAARADARARDRGQLLRDKSEELLSLCLQLMHNLHVFSMYLSKTAKARADGAPLPEHPMDSLEPDPSGRARAIVVLYFTDHLDRLNAFLLSQQSLLAYCNGQIHVIANQPSKWLHEIGTAYIPEYQRQMATVTENYGILVAHLQLEVRRSIP